MNNKSLSIIYVFALGIIVSFAISVNTATASQSCPPSLTSWYNATNGAIIYQCSYGVCLSGSCISWKTQEAGCFPVTCPGPTCKCSSDVDATEYNKCMSNSCCSTDSDCAPVSCSRCSNTYPCQRAYWTNPHGVSCDTVTQPVTYSLDSTCTNLCSPGQICVGSDCVTKPACSVTASASPNPIPVGQNQTTISKSGSGYSSCTGTGTFTQTDSSHTYTVSCTGDSTHSNCSDSVTVTKQIQTCANTTCSRCSSNNNCQRVSWTDCAATCSADPTTSSTVKSGTLTRTYDSTCTGLCTDGCGCAPIVGDNTKGTCISSYSCSRCSIETSHACDWATWTNCGPCDSYSLKPGTTPSYQRDCTRCSTNSICIASNYCVVNKPDLIINSITFSPANPSPGTSATITVTEKNQGSANAGAHYVDLKIDGISQGTKYVSSLNGNSYINLTWSYTCPTNNCSSHNIIAIADSSFNIDESNENNNNGTATLTCSSSYSIDLWPSTYGPIQSGGNVTLYWTTSGMKSNSCTASANPSNSQWTGSKADNNSNTGQMITNLTQTTTFYLTCNDLCGYSRSDNETVTVGSNSLSVTINAGTCSSGSVTATATASGGTGSYSSYDWYADNTYKSTTYGSTNSYTYNNLSSGNHNLYVIVKDSSNTTATSPIYTVNCGTPTSLSVTMTAGTCSSGSVSATATASGGTGSYWYYWYDGINSVGVTNNQNTYTYTNLSSGNHNLYVIIQDKSTFTTATSNTVSVNCGTPTSLSVTMTAGTCSNGSVSATATASGGTGSYTNYFWYDGNTSYGFTTTNTYTYTGLSSGDHSLSVIVRDSSNAYATSPVVTVNCGISNILSVSLSVPSCSNGSAAATATASGGTGIYTKYSWYRDGSWVTDTIANTYTYTGLSNGSHKFLVFVLDSSPAAVPSNEVTADCTGGGGSLSVILSANDCSSGSVTATATASGGSGTYSTYDWYADGTKKGSITTNIYTYNNLSDGNHDFYVIVQDSAGATAMSNTVTVNCAPPQTYWKCDINKSECVQDVNGTYSDKGSCDSSCKCTIQLFTINGRTSKDKPLTVFVGQKLKGEVSITDVCQTCIVTSNNGWNETYSVSSSNSYFSKDNIQISNPGTYSYTLTCEDAVGNQVQDILSLQAVKAVPLPWWREIIPNLLPFLRGMIR